jgi:hypothetical protein
MTRRQFLSLILVNALVSLAIAVAVVLIAFNLGMNRSLVAPITDTVAITATEALTATAIPGEAMITTVLAPGELTDEAVRLVDIGETPIRLRNWSLQRPDGRRYFFPDATLEPNSALLVYSRQGADTEAALFWGLQEAAWRAGAVVTLADQAGRTVGSFAIGE